MKLAATPQMTTIRIRTGESARPTGYRRAADEPIAEMKTAPPIEVHIAAADRSTRRTRAMTIRMAVAAGPASVKMTLTTNRRQGHLDP